MSGHENDIYLYDESTPRQRNLPSFVTTHPRDEWLACINASPTGKENAESEDERDHDGIWSPFDEIKPS
jgi:hypothetical protein